MPLRIQNRINVNPSQYSSGTNKFIRNPLKLHVKSCLAPQSNISSSWRLKLYQPKTGKKFYKFTDAQKSSNSLPSRLTLARNVISRKCNYTRLYDTKRLYGHALLHLRGGGYFHDNVEEESPSNNGSCHQQLRRNQSSSSNGTGHNRQSKTTFKSNEHLTFTPNSSLQDNGNYCGSEINFSNAISPRTEYTRTETRIPTINSNEYIKIELSPRELFELITKSNTTEKFNNIQESANSFNDNDNLLSKCESSFESIENYNKVMDESSSRQNHTSIISLIEENEDGFRPCYTTDNKCKKSLIPNDEISYPEKSLSELENTSIISLIKKNGSHQMQNKTQEGDFKSCNKINNNCQRSSFTCQQNNQEFPSFENQNLRRSNLEDTSFPFMDNTQRVLLDSTKYRSLNLRNKSLPCINTSSPITQNTETSTSSIGSNITNQSSCHSLGIQNLNESSLVNESFPCVNSSGSCRSSHPNSWLQNTQNTRLENESFPFMESSHESQVNHTFERSIGNIPRCQNSHPSFGIQNTIESSLANESFPCMSSSGSCPSCKPISSLQNTREIIMENESCPVMESSYRRQVNHTSRKSIGSNQRCKTSLPSFGIQNTNESSLVDESFPCVNSSDSCRSSNSVSWLQNTQEPIAANESFPLMGNNQSIQSLHSCFGIQNILELPIENESFPSRETNMNSLEANIENESFPCLETDRTYQRSHSNLSRQIIPKSTFGSESSSYLDTSERSQPLHTYNRFPNTRFPNTMESTLANESFPHMKTGARCQTPQSSFERQYTMESTLAKESIPYKENSLSHPSFSIQNTRESTLANESFPFMEYSESSCPSFGIQNTLGSALENESCPYMNDSSLYQHLEISPSTVLNSDCYSQSHNYNESYIFEDPFTEVDTSTPTSSHISINKIPIPRKLIFDKNSTNSGAETPQPCSEITVETESLLSDLTNKPIGIKKTRNSFVHTPKLQYFKSVSILEPIPEIPNPHQYISPSENTGESCTCQDKQNNSSNKNMADKRNCLNRPNFVNNNNLETLATNSSRYHENSGQECDGYNLESRSERGRKNCDVFTVNYCFDESPLNLCENYFAQDFTHVDPPPISARYKTSNKFRPILTFINKYGSPLLPNLSSVDFINIENESNISLLNIYKNSLTSFSDLDASPLPE